MLDMGILYMFYVHTGQLVRNFYMNGSIPIIFFVPHDNMLVPE